MSDEGILKIIVKEGEGADPVPSRIHITGSDGTSYYAKNEIPYEIDHHFTCKGSCELTLPVGEYSILVEKGTEFKSITDTIQIQSGVTKVSEYKIERWITMVDQGWFSGELHIHRPFDQLAHLIEVEDLYVAPLLTLWNERNAWKDTPIPKEKTIPAGNNRQIGLLCQEDERGGGAVLLMNLQEPIDLGETSRWYPTGTAFCREAKKQGAHVDQEKPFWWEAPVNVAAGVVDTMGIVNNHFWRDGLLDKGAWGRPQDTDRYPGREGFVLYVLDLYYHYLNLGLKISISAGSASGALLNPVGYNRLYAPLDDFSYDNWFKAVKAGNTFATNGPMLFFDMENARLGDTLRFESGTHVRKVNLKVCSQNELDRIEIIYNGEVRHKFIPGGNKKELNEKIELELNKSGWIVVRAFEQHANTIRLAHTNPIYVEIDGPMKPQPESARFYTDWCVELLEQSQKDTGRYENEKQRKEVEDEYRQAVKYYHNLGG